MTGVGGLSKIAGRAVWIWTAKPADVGIGSSGCEHDLWALWTKVPLVPCSDAMGMCQRGMQHFPAERRDLLWVNPCLCLCLYKSYVLLHGCNESSVRSWNKNKTKKCKIEGGVWKRPSLFHSSRELIDSSNTHRSSFLHEPFIKKILLLVFLYLFLRYSTRGLDSFLQVLVYIIFYNFKVY